MIIVAYVIGIILVSFFIILQYAKLKCNKKIKATFIKCKKYGYGLCSRYAPIFKYDIDGKEYEFQTFQAFKKKYVKDYINGEKYDILIWKDKPGTFIISKKVFCNEIIILIMGVLFFIAGILLLMI